MYLGETDGGASPHQHRGVFVIAVSTDPLPPKHGACIWRQGLSLRAAANLQNRSSKLRSQGKKVEANPGSPPSQSWTATHPKNHGLVALGIGFQFRSFHRRCCHVPCSYSHQKRVDSRRSCKNNCTAVKRHTSRVHSLLVERSTGHATTPAMKASKLKPMPRQRARGSWGR